jgi:hypothetical protein
LKGKKVPKKKRKEAKHIKAKAGSVNGLMKSNASNFFGLGVSLDLTVRFATINIPRIVKATVRIVHGNPIKGMSLVTIIGKITPPSDDPEAITPKAVALFLKNHVPTELIAE